MLVEAGQARWRFKKWGSQSHRIAFYVELGEQSPIQAFAFNTPLWLSTVFADC